MKTIYSIIFLSVIFLASCGGNKSKDQEQQNEETTVSKEEATSQTAEVTEFKEAKNCDEFIDQYDKWTDNYLVFIEKYMKNPTDATLLQEYTTMSQEAANWFTNWSTKMITCASDEKYQKRFEEIGDKVDKKMTELGLN